MNKVSNNQLLENSSHGIYPQKDPQKRAMFGIEEVESRYTLGWLASDVVFFIGILILVLVGICSESWKGFFLQGK